MKLSSPRKWRRDMIRLLGILRERNPDAVIFITNCPMLKYSPALPHPIKFLLWELSKMHDANIREFTSDMDRVLYYHQPTGFKVDGFFADGMPFAMEFLGRPFSEPKLITLASGYEAATQHRKAPATTPALPGEKITY